MVNCMQNETHKRKDARNVVGVVARSTAGGVDSGADGTGRVASSVEGTKSGGEARCKPSELRAVSGDLGARVAVGCEIIGG